MTGESEVYLIDSSILNDLDNGEILEELADLPYHFYCTDFVEMEFKPRSGHHLPSNILIQELNPSQVSRIMTYRYHYPGLSAQDISSIVVATDASWNILTSDRVMRNAAEQEHIEVHGIFWILDRLVDEDIITENQACDTLEKILRCHARLPQNEWRERFRRWHCHTIR